MSAKIESYGCGLKFRVTNHFGITDITAKDLGVVKQIVDDAFRKAEDEIEGQLYKQGLMTCNGMLCSIAEMKEFGSGLVQIHIKRLDEKYKEGQQNA